MGKTIENDRHGEPSRDDPSNEAIIAKVRKGDNVQMEIVCEKLQGDCSGRANDVHCPFVIEA